MLSGTMSNLRRTQNRRSSCQYIEQFPIKKKEIWQDFSSHICFFFIECILFQYYFHKLFLAAFENDPILSDGIHLQHGLGVRDLLPV